MKTKLNLLAAGMFLAATSSALATVHYVWQSSPSPTPPYTNWATAATDIQSAVDAAGAGDEIVVTNGTYAPVTVDTPLALQSVNGPGVTLINGGGTAGCLYLTNDAVAVGFTLTNGVARYGGGLYGYGGGVFCESTSAVLSNCVLTGNSAYGVLMFMYGGSCGGGACGGTLNNCTLTGNSADGEGGGAYGGTLNNCTLTGNSAEEGGGASSCTLNNCIVYYNSAPVAPNYHENSSLNYCCTTPLPGSGIGNISADPQLADPAHLSAASPCRGAGSPAYSSGTDIDGQPWANPPSIGCDEFYADAINGPLSVAILADYTNAATGFAVSFTAQILGPASASLWDFGDGTVVRNRPYASHAWMATGDYTVILRAYNDTYPGGVAASVTVHVMAQPVHYVALSSASPVPPYSSWATAATNIQDAVDATSVPGALVLVSNGVYQAVVVVTKPVTMRSVNGPGATVIDGSGTVRCLYLTSDAVLMGFTLTNGVVSTGGGLADAGGGAFCESASAVLTNCVLTGNWAFDGGGAYGGTLNNCTLSGNSAWDSGGGAYGGTLKNCTLSGNTATGFSLGGGPVSGGYGGGASSCTLDNCTLTGNSARGYGGGAAGSTLNNCTLTGNSDGAGACTLNNCVVCGNTGGGASGGTLNNCTVTGNTGGGASSATLNNCIVCFNSDPNGGNYDRSSTLNYCCTTPMPTNGVGNISADPQLASTSHLSAESPCIGAGSATYARGTDIDGEAWTSPPSIGCDEYHAGAVTGPLTVSLTATLTNALVGHPVGLTAFIEGRTDLSVWDFGDGFVEVNEPYTSHTWTAPGYYLVALWAFNDSYPEGVSATATIYVDEGEHYVAANSASPVAPYTSWATAARNIQDAVDVAAAGATLFVTNGIYAAGGRTTPSPGDGATNRVAVDKPLTVRSVNGPGVTVIQGQMPGATNGYLRCIYLTYDAVLVGFTLTNGVAVYGGGVYCESSALLSNCTLTGSSALDENGNFAGNGGGAYGGTLNNCTLTGNSAVEDGGGAVASTLNNCTLTGNSATGWGGGADGCTLNNCTLTGNSAGQGGGADGGTLNNCTLTGNWATSAGGGAYGSTLNNCTLSGNSANGNYGSGGGAYGGTLYNCIVYYNSAVQGANYDLYSTLNYCCTTPQPTNGVGNLALDPQLASASHLSAGSPCRGAGNAAYATGADIDGEAWASPPSIGCDEYHAGAVTGPLSVALLASYTNVAVGYSVGLTALIEGRTTASVWEFGDGVVVSNRPYANHAWTAGGDYTVALWAFNDSHPEGVSATVTMHVVAQPVHYVGANSANPLPPYTSWATAARAIQDAVDLAAAGAEVVVTNGVYAAGLALAKPLTVRSVNGPQFTVVNAGGAIRCAYLTDGASLSGFTLCNGVADSGGGAWCTTSATITNCVITGNSANNGGGVYGGMIVGSIVANNSAASSGGGVFGSLLHDCTLTGNETTGPIGASGGGACQSTLYNCLVTSNQASVRIGLGGSGGGASSSTLYQCILIGNSAREGGGVSVSTLYNCTVVSNGAEIGGGTYFGTLYNSIVYYNFYGENYVSTFDHSCTTGIQFDEGGNISMEPAFADLAAGNLQLQSNSPCINAGKNSYVTETTDLGGNPRIAGGTVDIGAYEFQTPTSLISYAWLQQYGLPTDGSADFTDPDRDGLNNWQEWRCGTCPTNANSALRLLSAQPTGTNVTVTWQSVAGVSYFLECSTNLGAQPAFSTIQSNIIGQAGTTSYTDTTATNAGPYFYRVGVEQ